MARRTRKQKAVILRNLAVGVAVSGLALWWVLRDIDWARVGAALSDVSLFYVSLAFAGTMVSYVLRAWRWPIFFEKGGPSFSDSFRCLIVGFFMNNVLPARLGEFVRAHLGGRAIDQSRSLVLATIAGERLADGLMISSLFAVLFGFTATSNEFNESRELVWVAYGFAGIAFFTAVLLWQCHRAYKLLEHLGTIFPGHLSNYTLVRVGRFIEGLEPMLHLPRLARIATYTVLVWGIELMVYAFVARAFAQPLSLGHLALFLAAVNFSSLIPAAPGGVGVIEAFATLALVHVGVERETALAMVVTQHMIQILVVGIPGSLYFVFEMGGRLPVSDDDENGDVEIKPFADVSLPRRLLSGAVESNDEDSFSVPDTGVTVALSVIVPAYNEEDRLPKTLLSIIDYLDNRGAEYEVLVVNDGSTDKTDKVVHQFERRFPQVRLLQYGENRGKGFAVRFGVMHAGGELILYTDADGASPIEELERLESAVNQGAQVAIGSRALYSHDTTVNTLWLRKFVGRIFNGIVNFVMLPGIADTQCGFKLFRRPVARYVFSRSKSEGFSFDVEILFLARKLGARIAEVPINWTNVPGSKVNLVRDSARMFRDIIVFRLRDIFGGYGRNVAIEELGTEQRA